MQPMLAVTAPHPGLIYINGRFSGEVSREQPLLRPVCPTGALYLDYRPLTRACEAMARRIVFSGGAPLQESVESAEDVRAVLWPGNVTELELLPEPRAQPPRTFSLSGHEFRLEGLPPRLSCDGRALCTLPDGPELPEPHLLPEGAILLGRASEGMYLLSMDPDFRGETGFLRARQIDIEGGGRIRAVVAPEDSVGHATLEIWRLTAEGLTLVTSEPAWAQGAPRWPQTPVQTAMAAVEAALAGLDAEAEGYLAPSLRRGFSADRLREACDLCVEMKYAPPDARPCVGLLRLEGGNLARVAPLYYRCTASGGPQGPYQIDLFEFP